MAHEVTCDGCQNKLLVPDDFRETWLTCPRCLARLVNPAALVIDNTSPATSPPSPETPSCSRCGRPVEPGWQACPYCALTLQPAATKFQTEPSAASTAGTALQSSGRGLAGLGALGALGGFLAMGTGRGMEDVIIGLLVGVVSGFTALVGASLAIAGHTRARRVQHGLAVTAGTGFGCLWVLLTALVLFFITCFGR